jgi:hypothetical protein
LATSFISFIHTIFANKPIVQPVSIATCMQIGLFASGKFTYNQCRVNLEPGRGQNYFGGPVTKWESPVAVKKSSG